MQPYEQQLLWAQRDVTGSKMLAAYDKNDDK